MCNATHLEARSKSAATLAPLASLSEDVCPDAKSTTPSAAMDNLHPQASRSSSDSDGASSGATVPIVAPDEHSAGDKRRRHSQPDDEVEDWEPGMGLRQDDDADLYPQPRLAATSLLFERLVHQAAIIRAHVIKRHRQDLVERGISRQIAERHPLRPHAEPQAKSIPSELEALPVLGIPCELASPPLGADASGAPLRAKSANCPAQLTDIVKVVGPPTTSPRLCKMVGPVRCGQVVRA